MKVRFPIYAQTLGFLLLHLALLLALFLLVFNSRFGPGWDALITSPVGDRLEAIAWIIRRQMEERPVSDWNNILEEFGGIYGVKFSIFDASGRQLAGQSIDLPAAVRSRIIMRLPNQPFDETFRAAGKSLSTRKPVPIPLGLGAPWRHHRFLVHTADPNCFWIGVRMRVQQPTKLPATLIASSPNLWQTRLILDFGLLLMTVAAILVLSILIWLPFVYRITAALSKLTTATEKIAEGQFDTYLKGDQWDEIGSLKEAVNTMAQRLNSFVSGQKRFLGDIAHELCSPISRLQVALELLQSTQTEQQAAIIQDIREEVQEMSNLINELLAFSRAGLRGAEVQLLAVNLESILKKAIAKTCPESLVTLDVPHDLHVLGDQLLLERAISNILRNAVRYASGSGPIEVRAVRSGAEVLLKIADSGPGVLPEVLALLGQPFFRPEPSRSRTSGGVGLGLAIVKTCVEACQGTFKLRNREPRGLKVELCLKACSTADSKVASAAAEEN